ncbi:MAG: DnaJ domain-containing protein [Methylococcales bacterium]|nr:DnaJ domain-containing protein [Methylococcales bacterium]
MKTPYEILSVETDASDSDIKQAYLQQVKINPPDTHQEQFQIIHNAYDVIKDKKGRLSYALFSLPNANFDTLIDAALKTEQPLTLNADALQKILKMSVDNTSLLNALTDSNKP